MSVSDRAFTDTILDRGDWLKASVGFAGWTTPGVVSCSVGVTR